MEDWQAVVALGEAIESWEFEDLAGFLTNGLPGRCRDGKYDYYSHFREAHLVIIGARGEFLALAWAGKAFPRPHKHGIGQDRAKDIFARLSQDLRLPRDQVDRIKERIFPKKEG